ncbi:MAG: 3-oxoacid CoA-transferase subunit A [Alphaproteobacteria bacterium]|nr:3-oxoacid CoA-transferase subunit A [Alphaproteobacteria bacterium]
MKKILTISEAGKLIKSDSSVMIGGFLRCGSPARIVDEILKNDIDNLTLIANDTCIPEADRGKLIVNKRIKKAIVAHIGTNPETGRQMDAGELEVELVPMGTLVERIRAAGAGLGGVLTPTGVGTIVENGKTIMEIEGKKYLFEKPLKADYAIIYATKADKYGNLFLQGTTRNFNTVMATAADVVIVEADELSEEPLNPDEITIPGVFVNYIAI